MANETTYSILSDSRATEILRAEWLRLLAAREPLPAHPAILYHGDLAGQGSSSFKGTLAGLDGYDLLAATNDAAAASNTALTDASYTGTVARYSKVYAPTDLALGTDPGLGLTPERFALDAFVSAQQTLVNLVAAMGSGFTGNTAVGSSGSNLTFAQFLEAKAALEIGNAAEGGLLAILHPRQWNDLVQDAYLTVSAGSIQFDMANAELTRQTGGSYKGTVAGVQVYTSTRVPTANGGADRSGFMVGKNAIAYAEMTVPVLDPTKQINVGPVMFEWSRNAASGLWQWVTHYYVGVAEVIDAAGIGIVTDA